MSWLNLVSDLDDTDAPRLAACMAAIEGGGLLHLVHEESGARRLLPRAVIDALSKERGTVAAVLAMIRSAGADEGIVGRQRAGWQAMTDAFMDGDGVAKCDDDGHDSEAGTIGSTWDDRTDAECLVHAMDGAAFESREAWGLFMLAVGVSAGLAWSSRVDDSVTVEPIGLTGVVGLAADWCDERAERDGLSGAA